MKVPNPEYKLRSVIESDEMEVDANVVASISSLPGIPAELQADIHLRSDGILLYVAEAAYESGTSPLSAWIPSSVQANAGAPHDRNVVAGASENEAPLIVFSRCVHGGLPIASRLLKCEQIIAKATACRSFNLRPHGGIVEVGLVFFCFPILRFS